jgi:site-specific DNA-methyltransferase (adenine-specific)
MSVILETCDNLDLLVRLPDCHVDMIYCDILYGTGRDFKDYRDLPLDLGVFREHYIPRFTEMRRVLRDTGTIHIHTGVHTCHWVRCLLDEVFGMGNFRNQIIWSYNSAPRKKNCFGNRHDVILKYSKTDGYKFIPVREPYSETAPRGYEKEKYYHSDGKVIGDVWNIGILGQNDKTERVGYQTQKPLKLLRRIIESSTDPGDLVADFYLGSGTTVVACVEMGREFIGCDINPKSIETTKNRLKK